MPKLTHLVLIKENLSSFEDSCVSKKIQTKSSLVSNFGETRFLKFIYTV